MQHELYWKWLHGHTWEVHSSPDEFSIMSASTTRLPWYMTMLSQQNRSRLPYSPELSTFLGMAEAAVLISHLTYTIRVIDNYHSLHLLFRIVWSRQWRFLLFCHYHWFPADTPNFWDDMHTNAATCLVNTIRCWKFSHILSSICLFLHMCVWDV